MNDLPAISPIRAALGCRCPRCGQVQSVRQTTPSAPDTARPAQGATVTFCPSAEQLGRLLTEQLGDPERSTIEAHVETCASCQAWLQKQVEAAQSKSRAASGQTTDLASASISSQFLAALK